MTTPFPDPQQPAQLAEPVADPNRTVADLSGGGADDNPLSRAPTLTQLDGPALEMAHPVVPGYQILGVLGRGGMGVVYKARQVGLHRLVALKMILSAGHASPEEMVRFLGEAEAVARLQHTNIVQIYQIGKQGELPFFSLEYIDGGTLAQRLHGVPQQPRDAAQMVECLAHAIHLAHQKGIVHRDLKPNNILLTLAATAPCADGDTPKNGAPAAAPAQPPLSACTPKITDFGLAKQVEGGIGLTQTGAIMGTPSYMAPEQAQAKKDIGPAADIYALGAILYEMLTGRPPFRAPTPLETVLLVISSEPVAPSRLQPGCPRDLETICLKCLHKEPGKRYATAAALADDLQRFLTDRPIFARRTGSLERTRRWCRRNPVVAGMTAALALLLIVLAVGASVSALWLRAERNRALKNLDIAKDAERRRTEQLATSYLEQARARRFSRQVGQHFQSLAALAEAAHIVHNMNLDDEAREQWLQQLRNEAVACLALADLRPQRRLDDVFIETHGTGFQKAVAFAPSWDVYARAEAGGPISVRNLADDREIARLPGTGPSAYILAFSPDGRYLVAKYYHLQKPIEYVIWDWQRHRKVGGQPCAFTISPTVDFTFTSDGRHVLLGCRSDGSLACYELATGKAAYFMEMGGQETWAIAQNAASGRLATANSGGAEVTIRDAKTGAPVAAPWKLPSNVWSLAWDSGSNLLAAGCDNHRIYLWDATAGRPRGVLEGHEGSVVKLAFNPAGTLLASYGWDGMTRLWDPASGKELLSIPGDFLEFSPDGRRLAYVKGKELGIWDVADGGVCRLLAHPAEVLHAQFRTDGRLLIAAAVDGAHLWDVARGKQLAHLEQTRTDAALFLPSGDILTTPWSRGVNRWPVRPAQQGGLQLGPPTLVRQPATGRLNGAALDADAHKLAIVEFQRRMIVLDPDGMSEPLVFAGHPLVSYVTLSPDGHWAATSTFKGVDVKVWDLSNGAPLKETVSFRAGDRATVHFSLDGRWLVVDEPVRQERYFYRVGSWELARQESISIVSGVDSTADGMMAAPSQGGREVRLFDPDTGRTWVALPAIQNQHLEAANLSRDGSQLAAIAGRFLQVWDLRAVRAQLAEIDLDWKRDAYPPAWPAAEQPLAVTLDGAPAAVVPPPVVILPALPRPRPAKPDEIAAWVRQLDAADDKVRQTAADALLAVGAPAVEALKAAAQGSDSSRRQQARIVLDRIAAAEALAPTRVRLKLDEALPADAIKELAARSGIPMTYTPPPEGVSPKRISLDLEDVSVWEALDRICEAADLGHGTIGRSTVHVSQQSRRPTVRGYAGPFRVSLAVASYFRSLNLYGSIPQTNEGLQLQLLLLKEPHTRLLSVRQAHLTEASTDDGRSLLPAVQPTPAPYAVNEEILLSPLFAPLRPPERRSDRLKVLKGVLSMEVMVRPQDLVTVPNLLKAKGRTFHGDQGHRVTVDEVQTTGKQWTVQVRLLGPPGWRFDQNHEALELVDSRGRFVRFLNPALLAKPVREPQPEDLAWLTATPQALPWAALAMRRSRGQRLEWDGTLNLLTPMPLTEPVKLRVYRFERMQAELPFEMHDVPLP